MKDGLTKDELQEAICQSKPLYHCYYANDGAGGAFLAGCEHSPELCGRISIENYDRLVEGYFPAEEE